jgi:nitronate monooxygenase
MNRKVSLTSRLGMRLPIIQGPFGGGLSTVKLAVAVTNAGGMGSYGAHLLDPEELSTPPLRSEPKHGGLL